MSNVVQKSFFSIDDLNESVNWFKLDIPLFYGNKSNNVRKNQHVETP
jgi:hypothetical protein